MSGGVMRPRVQYERPVEAKLWVHLDNGEQWEATEEDVEKFRFVDPTELYFTFSRTLAGEILGIRDEEIDTDGMDLYSGEGMDLVNIIRYLAETVIYHGYHPKEHFDPTDWEQLKRAVEALIEKGTSIEEAQDQDG